MNCPLCGRFLPAGSLRCTGCGADFTDPDVKAMISAPKPAAPAVASSAVRNVGAGGLSIDKFLGMTSAGIADGSSLQRVGLFGALCLLVGFLIPIDLDFRGSEMPLALLERGPKAAILVPLILALAGGAVALLKRGTVPPAVIASMLAAGGLAELALGLAPFGAAAGTATSVPILTWSGMLIAGLGVSIRILRPADPFAKWVALAGTIVFIGGGLVSSAHVGRLVPIEYESLRRDAAGLDGSIIGLAWDGMESPLTKALGAVTLLGVLVLPLATALAFRAPTGVWDRAGNALRAIGVVIVLWISIGYAMGVFNMWGWSAGFYYTDEGRAIDMDVVSKALILGRVRLALLSAGATLWLTAGLASLYVWYRELRAGSSRTSSAR